MHAGSSDSEVNAHLKPFLETKDLQVAIVFKEVQDHSSLAGKLEEVMSTLKEILMDLGSNFEEYVQEITSDVRQEGNSTVLLIGFGKNQILSEL